MKKVDRRYSAVARTIWSHPKFLILSAPKPNARDLVLRLLIAPEMTSIPGLFQAWDAGIARSLGWPFAAFMSCLKEVVDAGWVEIDSEVGVFWIPEAINQDANQPANPNVVRSWRQPLAEIPDCPIKSNAITALKAWAEAKGDAWWQALLEALGDRAPKASSNPSGKGRPKASVPPSPKTLPKQEQEQEQEQNPKAPLGLDIRSRCERLVGNPYDAQFSQPQTWPEVAEAAEILHHGLGYTSKPKLGTMGSDKGVSRIVEIFAAGFTIDELRTLQPKLKSHEFLRKAPRLHAVTVGILRELQDSPAFEEEKPRVVVSP